MTFPLIPMALGLAQFAPSIAKWLGGSDAERMAEKFIGIASQITGDVDPVKSYEALKKDAQMAIDFQCEVVKLEAQLELAFIQDRQGARLRDAHFIQTGIRNKRADVMVVCAALGLVMCLVSLTYFGQQLPGEAVGILSTIAGIFGACLKDAYAFEFGSSRGSREKDNTVATLLDRVG